MRMIKNIISLLALSVACSNTYAITLPECGRVVANQNGYYNFPAKRLCRGSEICPEQFTAILKHNEDTPHQQVHFTLLPMRALKDNTWVVANDKYQAFTFDNQSTENGNSSRKKLRINLDKIDSIDLESYRKQGLAIYRLADYVANDPQGQLCYMLDFKNRPNEEVIHEIDTLNINERTLLLAKNKQEAAWINEHQGKANIWFTGHAASSKELDDLISKHYSHLWSVRISGMDTRHLVYRVNRETTYFSQVECMKYQQFGSDPIVGPNESLRHNCLWPIVYKTHLLVTNRPIDCLMDIRPQP